MASKTVETAVISLLATEWDNCPVLVRNDEGAVPGDGSAFLFIEFPMTRDRRLPIGTRYYQEEGGVRILINIPRGSGMSVIQDYGDELAGIFRDRVVGTINFLRPTAPFTDDQSDQGKYWQGSMVVPFWRNYHG